MQTESHIIANKPIPFYWNTFYMAPIDFSPLNHFFDRIYVITIRRDLARQEKIKVELDGLDFNFMYGADFENFTVEDVIKQGLFNRQEAIKKHRHGKDITKGMLGCTISHRMVYEDVVRNGYNRVLIFEDDVVPIRENIPMFSSIMQQLPDNWELVYFDYNKNTTRNFFHRMKQNWYHVQKLVTGLTHTHTALNNLYARPYSSRLKIAGYHDFADAYAITQSAAHKFLDLQTPIVYWSDHLLAYCSSNEIVKGFISLPKLFYQESALPDFATESYTSEKR